MPNINVFIPDNIHKRLKLKLIKENKKIKEVIPKLVEDYIRSKR